MRLGPNEQTDTWVHSEKLSKGFAQRFRPTYAGANMGHPYGVVETGEA
jgi:hypothetical protein